MDLKYGLVPHSGTLVPGEGEVEEVAVVVVVDHGDVVGDGKGDDVVEDALLHHHSQDHLVVFLYLAYRLVLLFPSKDALDPSAIVGNA